MNAKHRWQINNDFSPPLTYYCEDCGKEVPSPLSNPQFWKDNLNKIDECKNIKGIKS